MGARSEGGEVWGGSAQLLGLRPATQYEVILMLLVDGGGWMNEKLSILLCAQAHIQLD